ncbi:RHS repeat domain-containing protein [Bacteroides sp.]|uniref:RHS repeat domain-containing protein n=1 Tax=Bacteroides sp. TaxID=29523 RepID=UPI0025C4A9B9|nr:RHS repeat domain-containing protein [Bacteroides sp.]
MKRTLFLWILFIYSMSLQAQIQTDVFIKNYTPSPEAYSLMEYSEIPVSLYTGVPDITIPIYTIQVGSYNLPISLRYHASGIKVAQEASRVGLGWSLHAGGSISRVVCGKDDFKDGFWTDTDSIPKEYEFSIPDHDYPYDENKDYEPDIFHYNFGEYSGKFYIYKGAKTLNLNNRFLLCNPEDNLKIEYNGYLDSGYFIITTPQNIKYRFDTQELKEKHGLGYIGDNYPTNEFPNKYSAYEPSWFDSRTTTVTSWYLSRIEYPTGEQIVFTYDLLFNAYLSPISISEKSLEILASHYRGITLNEFYNKRPQSSHYLTMENVYQQPELKKISWSEGYLEFISSDETRIDIRTPKFDNYKAQPKSLKSICLHSFNKKQPILTHTFYYSYFYGRNYNGKLENINSEHLYLATRLKLDSVSIQGTSTALQKYKMEYDMSDALPVKNSFACDKWGYYTGDLFERPFPSFTAKANFLKMEISTDFMPEMTNRIIVKEGSIHESFWGNTSSSSPAARTWMLTGLTNIAGGKTNFKYECNQVLSDELEWRMEDSIPPITLIKDYDEKEAVLTFDIPLSEGYMDIICTYDGNGYGIEAEEETNLIEIKNPRYIQKGLPEELENTGSPIHERYTFTHRIQFIKNTCSIKLKTAVRAKLTVEIKIYQAKQWQCEPYVGGVRIAEIKSPLSTRKFSYLTDIGICSGKLNREPIYASVGKLYIYNYFPQSHIVFRGIYQYIEYNSAPSQPLEDPYNGNYMGYVQVNVSHENKNEKLLEKSYFHNEKSGIFETINSVGKVIPLNGKLISYSVFSGDRLLSSDNYSYKSRLIGRIKGAKIHPDADSKNYYVEGYHTYIDKISSSYCEMIQGTNFCQNKNTQYEYNSQNHLVNRIIIKQTGQPDQETRIRYSIDYPNYHNGYLKKYNLVTTPIEESFYTDGILTKRLWHLHYNDSLVKPWKEYVFYNRPEYTIPPTFNGDISAYPGMPDITYTSYDKYSRNTSLQTRMGQSVVLLWGYKHQHIIAQLTNATLAEVKSLGVDVETLANREEPSEAEWNLLHSLRTKLPQTKVVITQYAPLIGIVSQTGPTGITTRYTYDEFGRLSETIETGEKEYVLQKNEYKYATEE